MSVPSPFQAHGQVSPKRLLEEHLMWPWAMWALTPQSRSSLMTSAEGHGRGRAEPVGQDLRTGLA